MKSALYGIVGAIQQKLLQSSYPLAFSFISIEVAQLAQEAGYLSGIFAHGTAELILPAISSAGT